VIRFRLQRVTGILLHAQENRRNVANIQVLRDVFRNDILIRFQQVKVTPPHFGRDLEAHMQQLAHAAVVIRRSLNMPQGRCVLLR